MIMNNKAKLIEKIKSQLKALLSGEMKFSEIKAGDLMISSPDEELVVGSEVFTIDADGNNIPLSDGEYTLDNGVKITVAAGKIDTMIAEEAPEAEAEVEVEAASEDVKPEEEAPVEDVKPEEDVMARLSAMEKKVEELSKMFSEKTVEMEQKFSSIAEKPAVNAIDVKPIEFSSIEDKRESSGKVDISSIRERIRANR